MNIPEMEERDKEKVQERSAAQPVSEPNHENNGPEGPDDDTAEPSIADLQARIQELEQENSDLKDQYLRKQADFENFRKRLQREKEENAAYSNQQLLSDIVTIIDDFERAIQSAEASRDFDSFHDGIVLIEKQFIGMLERKWGVERLDSVGEEFDPQKHEAVMSEMTNEHDHPIVVDDFQRGYMLHDRVLRAAKVKVALPVSGGTTGTDSNTDAREQDSSATSGERS